MESREGFTIIYNGHEFHVNKEYISLQSKVFRHLLKDQPKVLRLEGKFKIDSFNQFLKAIQGQEFNTTIENCDDIIKIAEEYQIKNLVRLMEEERERLFAPDNILLLAIQSHRENKPIQPFIKHLAQNISLMVTIPNFALLPVKVIDQVFSHPDCHPKSQGDLIRLFEALLEFKKKEDPSVLFNHIDFSQLSFEEMEHFLNISKLDKKAVINQVAKSSLTLMDIIRSEEEGNKDDVAKVQELIDDLKDQIDSITKMKAKIDSHAQQAARRLDVSKEKISKSKSYMVEVEKKLTQTCAKATIPGLPRPAPVNKHRPNLYIEWCQNGFKEGGPEPRKPPVKKTKTIAKNVYITSQFKIEAPICKVRAPSYPFGYNPENNTSKPSGGFQMSGKSFQTMNLETFKIEAPTDRPPIKIERRTTEKAVLETNGIKIDKPVKLETVIKTADATDAAENKNAEQQHQIKIEKPVRNQ